MEARKYSQLIPIIVLTTAYITLSFAAQGYIRVFLECPERQQVYLILGEPRGLHLPQSLTQCYQCLIVIPIIIMSVLVAA